MLSSQRKRKMDSSTEQAVDICSAVACRKTQIQLLQSLMGQRRDHCVASLFLYGHTGTGKSLLIKTLLQVQQLPYVIVNCVECYTLSLMYESILNSISGHVPSPQNDFTSYTRCDNMNLFIHTLTHLLQEQHPDGQTVYIVLENAERMRDMDINILPVFLRLQELTACNVTTVLISEIVWEKFRCGTGFVEPYIIHFPDYSKDELLEILLRDCPAGYSAEFYHMYCSLMLNVFYVVCRDLNELRHLALLNFPKYVEPIESGEVDESDTKKLWRNIEGHLKKALQTVYLREVSSTQWEKMQKLVDGENKAMPGFSSRINVELPFYSKYLLIAAYLASYNPAKSDRRFFSKNAGRINKKQTLVKKQERMTNQQLGPKPFPVDRLMAIFYSIVDSRVAPSANIFSQISSLVTLHLLANVCSDDYLDAPKYKCLVSLDFIKGISRTVNFDVARYLYDLN